MVILGGWVFLMSEVPLYGSGGGEAGSYVARHVPLDPSALTPNTVE